MQQLNTLRGAIIKFIHSQRFGGLQAVFLAEWTGAFDA
jgi:hypothetical protein